MADNEELDYEVETEEEGFDTEEGHEADGEQEEEESSGSSDVEASAKPNRKPRKRRKWLSDEEYEELVGKRVKQQFREYTAKLNEKDAYIDHILEEQRKRQAELESRIAKYEEDADVKALKAKEDELRSKLNAAFKSDDTDAVVKYTDELTEVRAERVMAQKYAKRQPVAEEVKPQEQTQPPTPQLPKAQQFWLKRNKGWYDGQNEKSKRANDIYRDLIEDGWDAEDPELYRTIDQRLKDEDEPEAQAPASRSRPSLSASGRNGSATSMNGGKPKFTLADRKRLIDLGGDPENKADVQAYMKAKLRAAQETSQE